MNNEPPIGYKEALALVLETVSPLKGDQELDLADSLGRILSRDLYSRVDSPSINASMKDGYAVLSHEVRHATPDNGVQLKITGTAAAGQQPGHDLTPGTAIRILSGARVPSGADAVLSEEFATRQEDLLTVFNTAKPGRNILPQGTDVRAGEMIATCGSRLNPGTIGTLVAAGHGTVPVFHLPRIAIVATGDELVIPGQPLPEGKLYASNMAMVRAWCLKYGMPTDVSILGDSPEAITTKIREKLATHDAVLTCGGAWTGDRDFVARTLDALGWKCLFHRIRMGPGKAVGFGMKDHKPIFLLPGGPPSNLTAFLQIALPGLLRLGGADQPGLPRITVKLCHELTSRDITWTQFVYGKLTEEDGHTLFTPLKLASRLQSLARADGAVAIPEGLKTLRSGAMVRAQLLF
ncbi:MAG: molybdopterin molybdotransferase MoeA [Pseudomonadota bacterium]